MKKYTKRLLESPIGDIELVASGDFLTEINFLDENSEKTSSRERNFDHPVLRQAARELSEYFSGNRKEFEIPIKAEGTEFQRSVWAELQKIPFGTTLSYRELAIKVGGANKVRAVGGANGKNPLPVIIPCHRVIRSDSSIGGYSGGIDRKEYLLKHESALLL